MTKVGGDWDGDYSVLTQEQRQEIKKALADTPDLFTLDGSNISNPPVMDGDYTKCHFEADGKTIDIRASNLWYWKIGEAPDDVAVLKRFLNKLDRILKPYF